MDEIDRLRREWDIADIKGSRFRRLLRFAVSEGLLPELLPERSGLVAELGGQSEPVVALGTIESKLPFQDLDCPQASSGLPHQ